MKSVSLGPKRFTAALSILDREERENPLSGKDQNLFKTLNRVAYGFVLAATLFGTFWSFWGLYLHWGKLEAYLHFVYVFVWTTVLFMPLHCMTFLIMIRLNWPLVRAVRRQEKMVEKLGLANALEAPWAGERAKRRMLNLVTLLVGPWLWAWGLFFVALVLLLPLPKTPPDFLFPVPGLEERAPLAWAVFACFLWTLLVGYMYVWLHRLRRGEERLRVVARLQSSLHGLKQSVEQHDEVKMSGSVYNQIARIEQAQISRARAESVRSFATDAEPTFVVQKSHAVRAAQLELDPEVGLQVQDAIESLAASVRRKAVTSVEATEVHWLKIPETALEISYLIDESARRLRVVSLRPVAGREMPEGTS